MKKLFTIALCICTTLMFFAQEQTSSETKMKSYSERIEEIVHQEKKNIKKELDAVDKDFDNKLISQQEKIQKREEVASKYEKIINDKVEAEKLSLEDFTKEKVKNAVLGKPSRYSFTLSSFQSTDDALLSISYNDSHSKKDFLKYRINFTISTGYVNLLPSAGSLDYFGAHDKMRGSSSSSNMSLGLTGQLGSPTSPIFYRTGLDYKQVLLNPSKPLVWQQNSEQLYLEEFVAGNLKRSDLRSHYFIIPIDFKFVLNPKYTEENGEKILDYSKPKFQIGAGVYGGARFLTQTYRVYKNEDDVRVKHRENISNKMNPFVLGGKFSISYRGFNIYVKKDFTPMFKNNTVLDNRYGMEIGFDFMSMVF